MIKRLDAAFKIVLMTAVLLVAGSIAYYFGYFRPHQEALVVTEQQQNVLLTETAKRLSESTALQEKNAVQDRYQRCRAQAESSYSDLWARDCRSGVAAARRQYETCISQGLGQNICKSWMSRMEANDNCSLPIQTANSNNAGREKDLDRCLQEMNAGISTGYNSEIVSQSAIKPFAAVPVLPKVEHPDEAPKAMTPQTFAACLLLSAQVHSVPAAVLIGMMRVEGGHIGQQDGPLANGSYKLGPMMLSSGLMPELAKGWKINPKQAYKMVRDDGCINVDVAAWLLRKKVDMAGNLIDGIKQFHTSDPEQGSVFAQQVVATMRDFGLATDVQKVGNSLQ